MRDNKNYNNLILIYGLRRMLVCIARPQGVVVQNAKRQLHSFVLRSYEAIHHRRFWRIHPI